jgi:hypothetical protein
MASYKFGRSQTYVTAASLILKIRNLLFVPLVWTGKVSITLVLVMAVE